MAIRTKHFERVGRDSIIRNVFTPGIGEIEKGIVEGVLPTLRQYGVADKDDATRANLVAGEGQPSMTEDVVTPNYGTFENCYKMRVNFTPMMTSLGGKIRYEIFWKQLSTIS